MFRDASKKAGLLENSRDPNNFPVVPSLAGEYEFMKNHFQHRAGRPVHFCFIDLPAYQPEGVPKKPKF
jgi:hypothetical protein